MAEDLEDQVADPADGEQWVTRSDAVRIVGCSKSSVRRWEQEGSVKSRRDEDGRTVLVWLEDVRERYADTTDTPTAVEKHAPDAMHALDVLVQRLDTLRDVAVDAGEARALRRETADLRERLERTERERDELRDRATTAEQLLARALSALSPRQRRRAGLPDPDQG